MGAGVSIFTGHNFGAGNYGRVRDMTKLANKYVFVWSIISGALMILFANEIPLLFDKDPTVIADTAQYLRIVPVSYAPLGIMIIINSALNAMGKPLPATTLILLRAFILYVPLAYIGEQQLGFIGILLALAMTNFIVGIASHLWNKVTTP
jgi:Na+-driven multidrug efflux pump